MQNESSKDNQQLQRLHREISETQQRRHRLDILKITFVTALLGFGGVKLGDIRSFYQALYLVPLVAVFFDLLIMGEHFSIRRIGAFLRLHSSDPLEQKWEKFVSERRDKFFKGGSRGFTVLSYVAAIALLYNAKDHLDLAEWAWFVGLLIAFVVMTIHGNRRLKELDQLPNEAQPLPGRRRQKSSA